MSTTEQSLTDLKILYKNQLFDNVLPFWLEHSIDRAHGGYFTCLDTDGEVFDTDKFIWLQCRQVWTFAKLYNDYEAREEWLSTALHGAQFLIQNGRDPKGNWYFSLNRQGQPLTQPYNIFSDCFAAMAFSQLYSATGDQEYSDIAQQTFNNILIRQNNPKGIYSKIYPNTRNLKSFALPMILSNLVLEMESVLDPDLVEKTLDHAVHEVMEVFYKPKFQTIIENVTDTGDFSDSFEGRLFNPGHVLEAMWFMMDIGQRRKNSNLIQQTVSISLKTLELGWDNKYGGLYYFLDILGRPPQQLEWDQKLWWVHLEAMVASLKGYQLSGHPEMRNHFLKLHNYSQNHFPDPQHGEWFGYLNRRGEVLLPLKGGKWKGCFHVPRGLYQIFTLLEKIENE
ncbi:AGE family epimerase/isomerase [Membranihabitans marinus]|uniref:AGE family epimerase/isomerase n=1 Tax=Membranihabitans marinus TaxID=1227546 RepID=UPI001F3FD651|nr:AGE family epimerase/isomerase [Membranihabitans marinus]